MPHHDILDKVLDNVRLFSNLIYTIQTQLI